MPCKSRNRRGPETVFGELFFSLSSRLVGQDSENSQVLTALEFSFFP